MLNGYQMDVLLLNGEVTYFFNELQQKGVTIYSLGSGNNIYNPLLIFKLLKYVCRYDIIHVHLFPSIYWVAIAKILSFSRVKLVMTEHSTDNRRRHFAFFKNVDRFIYKNYQKIISISEATTINLDSYLKIRSKVITIPNGIIIKDFQIKETTTKEKLLGICNDKKLIVQVAGFRKQKDQDTLIKALTLLPECFNIAFVGEGERRTICENLAKELGVFDRTKFCGNRNDIPMIMKVADFNVMSSHNEGFGRAAVEGMAAGKPTIASNVPGLAEVVGGAGLLFEAGDSDTLAKLILQLTNDAAFYGQVAERCKERAKQYDVKIMIEKYEQVYNTLIG